MQTQVSALRYNAHIPSLTLNDPTTEPYLANLAKSIAGNTRLSSKLPQLGRTPHDSPSCIDHKLRWLSEARLALGLYNDIFFMSLVEFLRAKSETPPSDWDTGVWQRWGKPIIESLNQIHAFSVTVSYLKQELKIDVDDERELKEVAQQVAMARVPTKHSSCEMRD